MSDTDLARLYLRTLRVQFRWIAPIAERSFKRREIARNTLEVFWCESGLEAGPVLELLPGFLMDDNVEADVERGVREAILR